jgi:hypothetical protein
MNTLPFLSRAVTLMELIATSIIVSFVMLGVFGADLALRRMDKGFSQDARVALQTKALAETIGASARKAHGTPYFNAVNRAISINTTASTLCFRQDVLVDGQYTPAIYNDDVWDCYTQIDTDVYRCSSQVSTGVCDAADEFAGALVKDEFTNPAIPVPSVTADQETGEYSFTMTLVGRLVPSAGAAVDAGELTAGTVDNPQVIVHIKENLAGF